MTTEQQAIARVEAIDAQEFETWYELGYFRGWDSDLSEIETIIDTAMRLTLETDTLLSDRMARARRIWEKENHDDTLLINTLERYRNISLSTAQDAMGEVPCNGYFLRRNLRSFTPEAQQWIQDNIQADFKRCLEEDDCSNDFIPYYLDELLATEPDALITAQALTAQACEALPEGQGLGIEAVNEIIALSRKIGGHTPAYKTTT